MTQFDAASVDAMLAEAASRAYDGVFEVVVQPTPHRMSGQSSGIPMAEAVAPVSAATARLYTFRANYRRRVLMGSLVADAGFDLVARGLLVRYALDQFDYVDRRYPLVYANGQRTNPD